MKPQPEAGARSGSPPRGGSTQDAGANPAGEPLETGVTPGRSRALLADALAQAIIPHLLQAQPTDGAASETHGNTRPPSQTILPTDVREMARLVLLPSDQPSRAAIQGLRVRGMPREVLCMELLAPTARLLGEWWEQDLCTFVDVTVGVGRLQQGLRDLSAGLSVRPLEGSALRRVLLVPAPGEQHTFGLVMVSEFFREAGWDVAGGPHPQIDQVALVRKDWFDVVGFSLAAEVHLPRLKPAIAAVRKASLNPQLGILVGGPLFLRDPGLAREVGADAVAVNGSLAPGIALKLIESASALA